MTEATRSLRWYGGLAVVLLGIAPAVMLSLLVAQGILGADPQLAARRLHLSLALVAGADLLMLGGNALLRMSAG